MPVEVVTVNARRCLIAFAWAFAVACGDGSPSRGLATEPEVRAPAEEPPSEEPGCASYDSTFAAIQNRIFARHGCAAEACHGSGRSGGLDLRPEVAWSNLVDVASASSADMRISPGAPASSFLFNKLRAATEPGSVSVGGSPMPVGAAALSPDELEAVRVWIAAGAPETGSVGDPRFQQGSSEYVNDLLGVCLPESELVEIRPLDPPAPGEGVQFRMPVHHIDAGSEWEGCFASWYDFSDEVPPEFQSPDGSAFYVNGTTIRQDAASHHLVVMEPGLGPDVLDHPAFGRWTCRAGPRAAEACDPVDRSSCGPGGICASTARPGVACIGYGPPGAQINPAGFGLGTALQSQVFVAPVPGAFREIPIRGLVYWNLHAFNLTAEGADLHARMNLLFAEDRQFEETHVSVGGPIPSVEPFTTQDTCGTFTVPKGATLIRLSSHTHRHGQHLWVDGPSGERMYESFYYSDPTYLVLDPPIVYDSPDAAERTLTFCVTFNNGLAEDGSPDLDLVTRRSRTPATSFNACTPVACTAGRIGEACSGASDHDACDSSPGSGDGECDGCRIQSGLTTEDEMFFLLPDLWLPAEGG